MGDKESSQCITPLMAAARYNSASAVGDLAAAGAKLDSTAEINGALWSSLAIAAASHAVDAIQALLRAGATRQLLGIRPLTHLAVHNAPPDLCICSQPEQAGAPAHQVQTAGTVCDRAPALHGISANDRAQGSSLALKGTLRALFHAGAKAAETDQYSTTVLYHAVLTENTDAVRSLLRYNADVASSAPVGKTLVAAIQRCNGRHHLLGLLLHFDQHLALLDHAAWRAALRAAIEHGCGGCAALLCHAQRAVVQHPVAGSACVSPLAHAAACGDAGVRVLRVLLQHGASIDGSAILLERQGACALTDPLMCAVKARSSAAVSALLDSCARADARSATGSTPLMVAAWHGDTAIARQLISARSCRVDAQDTFGTTALMLTSQHAHLEILELLLDNGADPFLQDCRGLTAYDRSLHATALLSWWAKLAQGGGSSALPLYTAAAASPENPSLQIWQSGELGWRLAALNTVRQKLARVAGFRTLQRAAAERASCAPRDVQQQQRGTLEQLCKVSGALGAVTEALLGALRGELARSDSPPCQHRDHVRCMHGLRLNSRRL